MPTVRVWADQWRNRDWRERFEADLVSSGWHVVSVEPPTAELPMGIYVLALEPAPAGSRAGDSARRVDAAGRVVPAEPAADPGAEPAA